MRTKQIIPLILVMLFSGIVMDSCKKAEQEYTSTNMEVTLPKLKLKHDLYYSISSFDRSIEMDFNETLDSNSVTGNVHFSDISGSLDGFIEIQVFGRKVMVVFDPGFALKDGWQYFLTVSTGVTTASGKHFQADKKLELRTVAVHPDMSVGIVPKDSVPRTAVAVISDIHLGDARANTLKYCWFGDNNTALLDLLDFIESGNEVKQVLILGDLFDEWIVPYTINPFDSQSGITNGKEYFHAVADNPVNQLIIAKLQDIASHQEIDLIYVHGNHDMLLTNEVLQEIIPGIIWKGDNIGLGIYFPVPEIVLEHGHRYDFFNCPQPLTNPGHILPPGYFISRLYAQGTMDHPGNLKSGEDISGSFEFKTAWDIAYLHTILQYKMVVNPYAMNILMGGIDNYPGPYSFHGIKEMYATNIEDLWGQTQVQNLVPYPMACCFHAIWNGHSDLYTAAEMEYLDPATAPKTYKIVGFGHTHEPLLQVYPKSSVYSGIYANSGSWIDASQTSYDVRTYLIITPGAWSGSAIDVVSLYQYNLETNSGNPAGGYAPKLLAEESI